MFINNWNRGFASIKSLMAADLKSSRVLIMNDSFHFDNNFEINRIKLYI